jgi:cytochrome c peroxidase
MTAAHMILMLLAWLVIPLGLDLYLPVPEDNPLTVEKIDLGRQLFNDVRLSRDGTIACSTCHDPARAFSVEQPVAVGVGGRTGRRNAPALINRGYGRTFFWDARSTTLEAQVVEPIQDPNEMDLTLDEATSRTGLESRTIANALASYIRTILSGNAPYDRYVNGDADALTPEQKAGLQLFRGKGNCTACHIGPNLSDERLHNTGVSWRDGRLTDVGAGRGEFKTATLREVARTAPYMHDGSLATLEDVIEFYSNGGRPSPSLDTEIRPLKFTDVEKRSLVAFLRALTGTVTDGRAQISAGTRETAAANPN